MPPKQDVNEAAAFVISPKMARALADTWRSRILMELSVRPLSPSMFVERFGGDLSHISRCFRQLAKWGFVEVAETQTGGSRRGGIEHIYRSVHRARIDTGAWEELPAALRGQFSGSILESYFARINEAFAAGTFDQEIDRHLSWDDTRLDRTAWEELGEKLDGILDWLPILAVESAQRMTENGEDPIPTTVGLAFFRAPHEIPARPQASDSGEAPPESAFPISAKMAKAMANKWRSRILTELRVRPMSPTEFANEIGGGRRHITRCFAQLAEWGYIEVAETRSGGSRRGGQEKFYRLKQRAYFNRESWSQLPRFLRDEFSAAILQSYFNRISEAIEAGTFSADIDQHLSWDGVALDRRAWTELVTRVDSILFWLPTAEEEASARLSRSGEDPIPTTVGLAVFRSPKSSEITPRNTIEL